MSKPETLEQIAERLAGQMFETSDPDLPEADLAFWLNACMILAALREVEAREGERCLAIIARSGERTEAADAERDEAVKRAEKAEAEVERLRELVTKLQVEANEQARLRGQPRP